MTQEQKLRRHAIRTIVLWISLLPAAGAAAHWRGTDAGTVTASLAFAALAIAAISLALLARTHFALEHTRMNQRIYREKQRLLASTEHDLSQMGETQRASVVAGMTPELRTFYDRGLDEGD